MWDSAGGITSSAYNFRQGNPLNRSEFYNDSVNHIYNLGILHVVMKINHLHSLKEKVFQIKLK